MNELSSKSPKFSAKFGLAVTLIAFLAACSSKKMNSEDADLNPVPANEVVQSQDNAAPTPFPESDDAVKPSTETAPKAKKSSSKHAVNRHKKTRLALHKHNNKKHALAVGRVNHNHPTPPAPKVEAPAPAPVMAEIQPAAPAVNPIVPVPPAPEADISAEGNRGWLIWALAAIFSAALVIGYRVTKRKPRGLLYNH